MLCHCMPLSQHTARRTPRIQRMLDEKANKLNRDGASLLISSVVKIFILNYTMRKFGNYYIFLKNTERFAIRRRWNFFRTVENDRDFLCVSVMAIIPQVSFQPQECIIRIKMIVKQENKGN